MNRARVETFFIELRRRRVLKAVLVYAITGWIVVQIAVTVFPLLRLPEWSATLVLALTLLGFPLMLVLAWTYDVTPTGVVHTPPREEVAAVPAKAAARPRSIAVLPFADMSTNQDQEHFGDGIAEEILNVLTRLDHLDVAARTSAFAFKGRQEDVRRIGEQLGVAAVLEGSVRTSGNRIRITAQLISVADGYHLWSQRFDRELGDIFAIQDEIAASIVQALDLQIGKHAQPRARAGTDNIQAYELYLRGRTGYNRMTHQGMLQALEMFEQAAASDPDYADAHAGIANASSFISMYWDHQAKHTDAAMEHSLRALTIAPQLAEAHVARGFAQSMSKDYIGARCEFEIAIAIDPMSYDAHYLYGRSCWAAGDLPGAARHFQRASEVRPEDYQALSLLGSINQGLGNLDEMRVATGAALERARRHLVLNPDDARALYLGAASLVDLERRDEAIEWAERALRIDANDTLTSYNVACIFAKMGEADRAFAALEVAMSGGWAHREWIANDGDWTLLRADPRFQAILNRLA